MIHVSQQIRYSATEVDANEVWLCRGAGVEKGFCRGAGGRLAASGPTRSGRVGVEQ